MPYHISYWVICILAKRSSTICVVKRVKVKGEFWLCRREILSSAKIFPVGFCSDLVPPQIICPIINMYSIPLKYHSITIYLCNITNYFLHLTPSLIVATCFLSFSSGQQASSSYDVPRQIFAAQSCLVSLKKYSCVYILLLHTCYCVPCCSLDFLMTTLTT